MSIQRFFKQWTLPYSLREREQQELERLEEVKVIEAVELVEWAIPIVPVIIREQSVRICGLHGHSPLGTKSGSIAFITG